MPIEECFSKVKQVLREHEAVAQAGQDIKLLITAAFASVTPLDCLAWSRDWLSTLVSQNECTCQHLILYN